MPKKTSVSTRSTASSTIAGSKIAESDQKRAKKSSAAQPKSSTKAKSVNSKKASGKIKSTTVNPRQRRQYLSAAERKQQILQAARDVFARTGLEGSRTRELAKAAGINQATLFEHFSSKEELFTAAVLQPLVENLAGSRERIQQYTEAHNKDELLALLQAGMAQHLLSIEEIFPLLVRGLFSNQELGRTIYREHLAPLFQARADVFAEYISDDLDPNLIQLATFGMFFAVAMEEYLTGQKRDANEVAAQLIQLITLKPGKK